MEYSRLISADKTDPVLYDSIAKDSLYGLLSQEVLAKIKVLADLPAVPESSGCGWLYGIDARSIHPRLLTPGQVVWLQCPWTPQEENTLSKVISDYLVNLVPYIGTGDYVCLGILITTLRRSLAKASRERVQRSCAITDSSVLMLI